MNDIKQYKVDIPKVLKWVGSKHTIIDTILSHTNKDILNSPEFTFIEPFAGSAALSLYILKHYKNCKRVVINDVNTGLINVYKQIRDNVDALIDLLTDLRLEYVGYEFGSTDREDMYYRCRDEYNAEPKNTVRSAALFMFINKTGFNGLYRENSKGLYNVSHGCKKNPAVFDVDTLKECSTLLQRAELYNKDFNSLLKEVYNKDEKTFVYFDPPYYVVKTNSEYSSYTANSFDDSCQKQIKELSDYIISNGGCTVQSNSDTSGSDKFFETLYNDKRYKIEYIPIRRSIKSGQWQNRTESLIYSIL
jgi:DNA adenine methylase